MKLITGGAYQGKTSFAAKMYGLLPGEITDCEHLNSDDFQSLKCVCNYHMFIKKQMTKSVDTLKITAEIIEKNPRIIIIMDEIGCGIIPIDRNERQWREEVGRAGCFLASHAESVERVICGCGVKLK